MNARSNDDHLGEGILGLLGLSPIEPADKANLEAHVAACPPCRRALDAHRQTLEALDGTAFRLRHEPSATFDAELFAKLDAIDAAAATAQATEAAAQGTRAAAQPGRTRTTRLGDAFHVPAALRSFGALRTFGAFRTFGTFRMAGALGVVGVVGLIGAALISVWVHIHGAHQRPSNANSDPSTFESAAFTLDEGEGRGADNVLEVAEFLDDAEDLSLYEDFGVVENFDVLEDLDVIQSLEEGSAG
ncbi:MAG: hypothetical protein H6729_10425 [Deltaproteobacteria bacterium]|nr:hypothetical protein [Deltaproteobacteria bacterium]